MVGEEYVAFVFLDVFPSFHFDTEEEEPEGAFRPELGQIISHDIGVAKKAGDDDAAGYENGDDYEDG